MSHPRKPSPWYTSLYFQVLVGIAGGVVLGLISPAAGAAVRPLGDGFIKLIKMIIAPVIFTTVVVGIGKVADAKEVGRIGLKAIVYFEIVSTCALFIGLGVGLLAHPGTGIHADAQALDPSAAQTYATASQALHASDFLLGVIPPTLVQAFAGGEILQVLLVSILCGLAAMSLGNAAAGFLQGVAQLNALLFRIVGFIVRLAPLGAFGAIGFTVGKYGAMALLSLVKLIACVYLSCIAFVVVVLGLVLWFCGINCFRFIRYLKEEILLTIGTSSSEVALPALMAKMENLGCSKPVVGLVIPTGYSFNLDGTSIYMAMAVTFIAQALDVPLRWTDYALLLGVLLLTSKGAAAVTGGGFVTLAATLSSVHVLPVAGLALLVGVDRFLSEVRAVTNLIGNAVATVVVSKWDRVFDSERARDVLAGRVNMPPFDELEFRVAAGAPPPGI
jgi:aerobic C4-dicarboxylate transport protein